MSKSGVVAMLSVGPVGAVTCDVVFVGLLILRALRADSNSCSNDINFLQ